ncbi:hypothetical protein P5673_009598 [Acropora cervicornis]|uniref:Uncharacterized protein n=1 Tax=Acropora cervicornis TaxID=6130 RepID=A0AAD9QS76_ACRCE|nr:hypothetical protein P5673_009598 [Acropora cervicornis]
MFLEAVVDEMCLIRSFRIWKSKLLPKFLDQALSDPRDTTPDLTQKNKNFAQVELGVLNKTQNPGLSCDFSTSKLGLGTFIPRIPHAIGKSSMLVLLFAAENSSEVQLPCSLK